MKLEMICTGEEVLAGQIVDTNAAWFANAMIDIGIECQRRVTVGDRLTDLISVFKERSLEADIILVNGGLGPTSDDLSTEAMALAMNVPLIENSEWRRQLENWFSRNNRHMSASNLKQTLLPDGALMVDNPVGTACGFAIKFNRAWFFFTPGVPSEFKRMVTEQFIPFIQQQFKVDHSVDVIKLLTLGIGESNLAELVEQQSLADGITLGYRSFAPYIEIKLFARGAKAIEQLPAVEHTLCQQLGDIVVAHNNTGLDSVIHHALLERGKTLSVAESCTGGMIASLLVAQAGSSGYFHQGLVTYCNESKIKLLGVAPETLIVHGAVSTATVEEMAQGVRSLLDSDYGLATSGIAGPDGGTPTKPVGTVAIALATREGVMSQMVKLPNRSRTLVRSLASAVAFDMLRRELEGTDVVVDYSSFKRL